MSAKHVADLDLRETNSAEQTIPVATSTDHIGFDCGCCVQPVRHTMLVQVVFETATRHPEFRRVDRDDVPRDGRRHPFGSLDGREVHSSVSMNRAPWLELKHHACLIYSVLRERLEQCCCRRSRILLDRRGCDRVWPAFDQRQQFVDHAVSDFLAQVPEAERQPVKSAEQQRVGIVSRRVVGVSWDCKSGCSNTHPCAFRSCPAPSTRGVRYR